MRQVDLENLRWITYREEVLDALNEGLSAAVLAVGTEAVGKVRERMQSGYGRPIRVTGNLMRDVNFKADENSIIIGNSLNYAEKIHNGRGRLRARPYLTDGVVMNADRLFEIWREYLEG